MNCFWNQNDSKRFWKLKKRTFWFFKQFGCYRNVSWNSEKHLRKIVSSKELVSVRDLPVRGVPVRGVPVRGAPVRVVPVRGVPVREREKSDPWARLFYNIDPSSNYELWRRKQRDFINIKIIFWIQNYVDKVACQIFRHAGLSQLGIRTARRLIWTCLRQFFWTILQKSQFQFFFEYF